MSDDFRPDQVEIEEVGTTEVRLVFSQDGGARQAVVLSKTQLLPIFVDLQAHIATGSGAPINMASLRPGMTIVVTSLGFGPRADHFRLTAIADLPDEGRTVTIPLNFSRKEVDECVKAMSRWLAKQSSP